MIDEEKQWQADTTHSDGATHREGEDLRRLLYQAEQQVRRLARRLQGRNRQVQLLEQGIALSVAIHGAWRANAESEMKEMRREIAALRAHRPRRRSLPNSADNVDVSLPYMTEPLSGVFDVMRDVSKHYDGRHPPKSTLIALAIDDRLGMRHQRNGDASRSAQAIASLIRPDPDRHGGANGRRRGQSDGQG